MIAPAIYSLLKNNAAIAALVVARIYPGTIIQGDAYPSIYFNVTSANGDHTKNGPAAFHFIDVSITCLDNLYKDCETLADLIRVALDGYEGTVETIKIENIIYNGRSDAGIDTTLIHQITQTFQIIAQQ